MGAGAAEGLPAQLYLQPRKFFAVLPSVTITAIDLAISRSAPLSSPLTPQLPIFDI